MVKPNSMSPSNNIAQQAKTQKTLPDANNYGWVQVVRKSSQNNKVYPTPKESVAKPQGVLELAPNNL